MTGAQPQGVSRAARLGRPGEEQTQPPATHAHNSGFAWRGVVGQSLIQGRRNG